MTNELISIRHLVDTANARGFRASLYNDGTYAEIHEALDGEPSGRTGMWHGGAQYSCAKYIINDKPSYIYPNKSPHPGFTRRDDHGVRKLLSHPRMAGF